jgi:colicin import membrane protein
METDTVKATWIGPFEAVMPGHAEPLVPGESMVDVPLEEADASEHWKVAGSSAKQSAPQKTAEEKKAEREQRKAAKAARKKAEQEAKAAAELEAAEAAKRAADAERVAAEERAIAEKAVS